MLPGGAVHGSGHRLVTGELAGAGDFPPHHHHQGIEPVEAGHRRRQPFIEQIVPPGMGQLVGQDIRQPVVFHPHRQHNGGMDRPQQHGSVDMDTLQHHSAPARVQGGQHIPGSLPGRPGRDAHQGGKAPVAPHIPPQPQACPCGPQAEPQFRGGEHSLPVCHRSGRLLRRARIFRHGRACRFPCLTLDLDRVGLTAEGNFRLGVGLVGPLLRQSRQRKGHPHRQNQAHQHQQPQIVNRRLAFDEGPNQQQQAGEQRPQQAQLQQGIQKGCHVSSLLLRPGCPAGLLTPRCHPRTADRAPPGRPPSAGPTRRTACQ